MSYCINVNHPEYLELLETSNLKPALLKAKIAVWMQENNSTDFPTLEELNVSPGSVNATLKIIDALEKIQRNVFTQDKLQGWINDLQKQGVSAQQIELFKEVVKPGMTRDEIATSIAANYSYTVEINTATKDITKNFNQRLNSSEEEYNSIKAKEVESSFNSSSITKTFYKTFGDNTYTRTITTNPITGKEENPQYFITPKTVSQTDYYSNLTVPGGTNYTEQEIATPAITPSIKGHAQFATDNGIGWFRSDDKVDNAKTAFDLGADEFIETEAGQRINPKNYTVAETGTPTKTRRILEVQSDLFQKGRDKENLVAGNLQSFDEKEFRYKDTEGSLNILARSRNENGALKIEWKNSEGSWEILGKDTFRSEIELQRFKDFIEKEINVKKENVSSNQFLQLLNKDNNWVTFFVKSIIQDSAKKGYEKVLFPSGDTASKVEGHTTLEEFKKQKENRIKELEKSIEFEVKREIGTSQYRVYKKGTNTSQSEGLTEEAANKRLLSLQEESKTWNIKEITQLKRELERVETEGFGALKPIWNFYENTVTNILKKQGYNPVLITDEYGNTWNEVEVKKEQATSTIFYQKDEAKFYQQKAKDIFFNEVRGKQLSNNDIININSKLRKLSDQIGDATWSLRKSQNTGNYYIAGYGNKSVTMDDYYSPYAGGMFRQRTTKSLESRVEELDKKLMSWAKKHGISVEALKAVMEKFPDRYDGTALGIADFAKNLIAIGDGARIDTLPEEVAHFAIELLIKDPTVVQALEEVVSTPEYAEVKEDYKDIYEEEIDFRKEALGKILAQEIVTNFKQAQENPNNGFWSKILDIANKFFNWVGINFSKKAPARTAIEAVVIPLANSILNQEYLGTADNVDLSMEDYATEAVKSTVIKPGVEELFESNPELANSIYEALGFKSKPDVILPIGTSGSGKSTFIKSLPQENLVVIEPDAMRVEFTGDMNDKSKDKEIYIEAANRAIQAIKQGKQVVFDTTNLTKDKRLPFIEAIKKTIPNANIQYKLMELNPELAKQRIKAQLERGENRAAVSDETIDRHAASYKQMLEDIKSEPIDNFELTPQQKQQAQQQYSQYLKTIFPDSKVKDIVYHGTDKDDIEFIKNNIEGYFAKVKGGTPNAIFFSKDKAPKGSVYDRKYNIPVILNLKNSFIRNDKGDRDNYPENYKTTINNAEKNKYDGVQILNTNDNFDTDVFVVFDPNQIYKLGSKQDIEGFKTFVNNSNQKKNKIFYQVAPNAQPVSNSNVEQKKKFLEEVVLKLTSRVNRFKNTAKSQTEIAALTIEIEKLQKLVAQSEFDLGISSFAQLASKELDSILTYLNKSLKNKTLNGEKLGLAQEFEEVYTSLFLELKQSMYEYEFEEDDIEALTAIIDNVENKLKQAEAMTKTLRKMLTKRVLEKGNLNAYGEKIDPNFNADEVTEATDEDMSSWRLWLGNYKFSNSGIIRTAHKIIFDSIAKVKRFTVQTGNEILQAQEKFLKAGYKIDELVQKDKDGKPTQYFVREINYSSYYAAIQETKANIAKALGRDDYSLIQVSLLEKDEKDVYNKFWSEFFKNNTKKVTNVNPDGTVSEARMPSDKYLEKDFLKKMEDPSFSEYYNLIIAKKREAVNKLPVQYRTENLVYSLPAIRKSFLERIGSKDQSYLSKIKGITKESFFVDQDDTIFGDLQDLNNKMVPIHFTRKFDNISDLSFDIARTVTLFAEMAENYKEMNAISGDLTAVQSTLAERKYGKKKGIQSADYQALETMLDTHVFGVEKKNVNFTIPENDFTKKIGINNKQFSWTKASQRFTSFIRTNNLAFNFATSISGWLKGSGDSIIEDQIGIYTTNESKNWSRVEFMSNLAHVIGEIGKPKQTNKMHLILQENEIVDINRMLFETTKNRVTRKTLNRDIFYVTFASGDYGLKGRATLAVYDNHRLYNDQFITRAKFYEKTAKEKGVTNDKKHQKEVGKQWESLREKSLYNAYEVVDGKLKVKDEFAPYIPDALANSIKGKVEHLANYLDGTLSPTDKGKLSRGIAGDFLLMHRGWFIGMMDTRLKRNNVNMISEEEEVGTYRATGSFLVEAFKQSLVKDKNLKGAIVAWNNLSDPYKRGVMKTALDLLYLNIAALAAAIFNVAADNADDDDFTIQYTAYQLNRLLLEQGAAWSPAELIQMIDEPVVGARFIKDVLDVTEAFNFGEVYKAGIYEDKSHARKWWMKKLPTRNLYELQFPELKNKFIKNLVDSHYYEYFSDEQKHFIISKKSMFDWLIPFNEGYSEELQQNNVRQVVNYLEEDNQEEYNEFN